MKSIFYFLNYFILLLIIIFFEEIYSLLDFTYPSAIGLMNQNVFIVEQNGVFVYDEELKNIIYSHTFEESEKITLPELKVCAKYCHQMHPIQCFDDDELNMAMYLSGIREGKRRGKEKFEISAMALAFLMAKWCSLDTIEYLQKKIRMHAPSVIDHMSEDDDE